MNDQVQILTQIRELLTLLAEPAIAKRDEKLRQALLRLVGKSKSKRAAVHLMNGIRTQAEIKTLAKIDAGDLSKLVKAMRQEKLLTINEKPELSIHIPNDIFEIND